jgi:hypothetical protein
MSWSVTVDNLSESSLRLPPDIEEYIGSQHPLYLSDLELAFEMAKRLGFASATLTGMRTPNPYGDDEVVDVSVRGLMVAKDFNATVKSIVEAGPDAPVE